MGVCGLTREVWLCRAYGAGIFLCLGDPALRAGLRSAAPLALGKDDLGNGSAFLARKSEGKAKRADLKDQRYIEECRKGKAHRPFGPGGACGERKAHFAQDKQECLCQWGR